MVLRETARVLVKRGILGPSGYHDCVQCIRVLGRLVEWTAEGITWEADPLHAELIRQDDQLLQLESGTSSMTSKGSSDQQGGP